MLPYLGSSTHIQPPIKYHEPRQRHKAKQIEMASKDVKKGSPLCINHRNLAPVPQRLSFRSANTFTNPTAQQTTTTPPGDKKLSPVSPISPPESVSPPPPFRLRNATQREKAHWWEIQGNRLGVFERQMFFFSQAAEHLSAHSDTLALLSEVRKCNGEGRKLWTEILMACRGTTDADELAVKEDVQTELETLMEQDASYAAQIRDLEAVMREIINLGPDFVPPPESDCAATPKPQEFQHEASSNSDTTSHQMVSSSISNQPHSTSNPESAADEDLAGSDHTKTTWGSRSPDPFYKTQDWRSQLVEQPIKTRRYVDAPRLTARKRQYIEPPREFPLSRTYKAPPHSRKEKHPSEQERAVNQSPTKPAKKVKRPKGAKGGEKGPDSKKAIRSAQALDATSSPKSARPSKKSQSNSTAKTVPAPENTTPPSPLPGQGCSGATAASHPRSAGIDTVLCKEESWQSSLPKSVPDLGGTRKASTPQQRPVLAQETETGFLPKGSVAEAEMEKGKGTATWNMPSQIVPERSNLLAEELQLHESVSSEANAESEADANEDKDEQEEGDRWTESPLNTWPRLSSMIPSPSTPGSPGTLKKAWNKL